ncbi:MAG: XRE family transcriptional regulator, partial [Aquimarina sp.]|nr:XRE family transcriptional regulator [Aquimarina sp.]
MQNKTIGKNLIYYRKAKGLTQQELSNLTEVTVRTIQRIEKNEVRPHLQTIKLLAVALELEVEALLPLDNPKEENIKKKWLLLIHATPILGFVIPFCNVLFPLFLWIHKREDNSIYNRHGIKVINFQITALIFYIISFIALVTVEKWGFLFFISIIPLTFLITLVNIIYVINTHKCYYPAIPFLRIKKSNIIKSILLLYIICGTFGCSSSANKSIERLDGSTIKKDSLSKKIDQLMSDASVQGLALSVFNKNDAVYQKTFGYKDFPNKMNLTDTTNIYGASLSKAVFSILVMNLVEEGIIDLDTPLESYLPKRIYEYEPKTRWHDNYSSLQNDSLYQKITARMCLAHTSGFPNWRWFEPDKQLRVKNIPGYTYSYSGEGFVYLQVVLEKITGQGLQELADKRIFRPLNMNNTAYEWKENFKEDFAYGHNNLGEKYKKDTDNEPRGGSTLETTAKDYTIFLEAVLKNKILSKESYEELFSPQIRIRSQTQFSEASMISTHKFDKINLSYGLGWGYIETPQGIGVFKEGHGNG